MQIHATYEEANARKYPMPIAIALAVDPQGKPNPITLEWVMPTSIDPPMLAISIGHTRYSLEAIRRAQAFVVAYPASDMARDAVFHGTRSGRELDKLAECGTATQPATKIAGVLLRDAVVNFECELTGELVTGDHVIFAGRVVASHVHKDPQVRRLYSLGNERMGGVVPG